MCIHEGRNTPAFQKLAATLLATYGLVPLTLVGRNDQQFSMFVTPGYDEGIAKAAADLESWHPSAVDFSDQSFDRIFPDFEATEAQQDQDIWVAEDYFHEVVRQIDLGDRRVSDSLDLDENDPASVYKTCVKNGYVKAA
jgi:hypothetical protein